MMDQPASNVCPSTVKIDFPWGPPVMLHCAEPVGHAGSHRGLSTEEGPMTSGRWVSWSDRDRSE